MAHELRHRLRNADAGLRLLLERAAGQPADTPAWRDQLALGLETLDELTDLGDRLVPAMSPCPPPTAGTLAELLAACGLPIADSLADAPTPQCRLAASNLLATAIRELAGQAPRDAALAWQDDPLALLLRLPHADAPPTDAPPLPFQTLAPGADPLGLYIAWRHCQAAGATLLLESHPDGGLQAKVLI